MNELNNVKKDQQTSELKLSHDLNIITAEVLQFKKWGKMTIYEIGKRLKHVKENLLVEGQWTRWCVETLDIAPSSASRYIKVFEEFGQQLLASELPLETLFNMAMLPLEERERIHLVPSTGEGKKIEEMSRGEMREVIKEINKEKRKQKQIEQGLEEEIESPKNVVVRYVDNKEQVENLQFELDMLKHDLEIKAKEKMVLEAELKIAKKDVEDFKNVKENLEYLQYEKEEILKQIHSVSEIGEFMSDIENLLKYELAPLKYTKAFEYVEESETVQKSLDNIVTKVENWCKEVRAMMPRKNFDSSNIIESE